MRLGNKYDLLDNPIFPKYNLVHFDDCTTYICFKHIDFKLYINFYDFDFDVEMINNDSDFGFDDLVDDLDIICTALRLGISLP